MNLSLNYEDQVTVYLSKQKENKVALSHDLFQRAIEKLTHENCAEKFFDFEDRLIEEVIHICRNYPPAVARDLVIRIKEIVYREISTAHYVQPYLKSLRKSVDGAVSAVLRFL